MLVLYTFIWDKIQHIHHVL